MCGICGQIRRSGLADRHKVASMQAAMAHRGPDGAGDFFDGEVGLAMRRLSIIDLILNPVGNTSQRIAKLSHTLAHLLDLTRGHILHRLDLSRRLTGLCRSK